NRAGSKFGGGGVASHSATNADRRERLRKLALETIVNDHLERHDILLETDSSLG
ncbi:MAG: hypothetical protein Q9183_007259, partial [Haloplaca sp. 2 TL-2023]